MLAQRELRAAADGAFEHSAQSDAIAFAMDSTTASSPDAAPRAGGSGGSAGTGGSGGVGVDARGTAAGGNPDSVDAAVPADLAGAFDVPTPFEATPRPDAAMDAPLPVDATPAGPGDGSVIDVTSETGGSPTLCSPVPKSTGGIACPGGKCTVGAYSGYTFTATDGLTSTVCVSANSLCAAGTTNTLKSNDGSANWGIAFGFFLSPNSTATNLVGVQLAGSGISVNLSSLPTGAQSRIQVTVGSTSYCATLSSATQTLPWTSFSTACWSNSGTYLTGAPTTATQIVITVNSKAGIAGSFDLCVTSLSFPGSETCPTGYHDDGTGACAPNSVCAAGYHIDGTGACVVSGTCSTGTCPGSVGPGGTCTSNQDCAPGYGCRGTTGGTVCSQNL